MGEICSLLYWLKPLSEISVPVCVQIDIDDVHLRFTFGGDLFYTRRVNITTMLVFGFDTLIMLIFFQ